MSVSSDLVVLQNEVDVVRIKLDEQATPITTARERISSQARNIVQLNQTQKSAFEQIQNKYKGEGVLRASNLIVQGNVSVEESVIAPKSILVSSTSSSFQSISTPSFSSDADTTNWQVNVSGSLDAPQSDILLDEGYVQLQNIENKGTLMHLHATQDIRCALLNTQRLDANNKIDIASAGRTPSFIIQPGIAAHLRSPQIRMAGKIIPSSTSNSIEIDTHTLEANVTNPTDSTLLMWNGGSWNIKDEFLQISTPSKMIEYDQDVGIGSNIQLQSLKADELLNGVVDTVTINNDFDGDVVCRNNQTQLQKIQNVPVETIQIALQSILDATPSNVPLSIASRDETGSIEGNVVGNISGYVDGIADTATYADSSYSCVELSGALSGPDITGTFYQTRVLSAAEGQITEDDLKPLSKALSISKHTIEPGTLAKHQDGVVLFHHVAIAKNVESLWLDTLSSIQFQDTSLNFQLPPSNRDFILYESVRFENKDAVKILECLSGSCVVLTINRQALWMRKNQPTLLLTSDVQSKFAIGLESEQFWIVYEKSDGFIYKKRIKNDNTISEEQNINQWKSMNIIDMALSSNKLGILSKESQLLIYDLTNNNLISSVDVSQQTGNIYVHEEYWIIIDDRMITFIKENIIVSSTTTQFPLRIIGFGTNVIWLCYNEYMLYYIKTNETQNIQSYDYIQEEVADGPIVSVIGDPSQPFIIPKNKFYSSIQSPYIFYFNQPIPSPVLSINKEWILFENGEIRWIIVETESKLEYLNTIQERKSFSGNSTLSFHYEMKHPTVLLIVPFNIFNLYIDMFILLKVEGITSEGEWIKTNITLKIVEGNFVYESSQPSIEAIVHPRYFILQSFNGSRQNKYFSGTIDVFYSRCFCEFISLY